MVKNDISEDIRDAMLKTISAQFKYSSFVNVVEEMEQNLYPNSQNKILYYLISQCNQLDSNKLFLTTHSPYLINYLTLAIKANQIFELSQGNENIKKQLSKIIPETSYVKSSDLNIYEIKDNGIASKLEFVRGLPSDNNFLNNLLAETNNVFNDLLDIEEQCQT